MAMWHWAGRARLRVAVDPHTRAATHRMGEKLARAKGKAQYAKRKWMSEGPNGWVKEVLGFRRFSLRGLDQGAGRMAPGVPRAEHQASWRRKPRDAGSRARCCLGLGMERMCDDTPRADDPPSRVPIVRARLRDRGHDTQAPSQTR